MILILNFHRFQHMLFMLIAQKLKCLSVCAPISIVVDLRTGIHEKADKQS